MMKHTSYVMSSTVKRIDHILRKRTNKADTEDKNDHSSVDGICNYKINNDEHINLEYF